VRFGPGRQPASRVPVRARATAELTPDTGAGGLPTHATGGGYDGPLHIARASRCDQMWRSPSTAWRPRRVRRQGSSCSSRAAFAPTPSKLGCSQHIRTQSGSPRPARACTATHRARPRPSECLPLARGERDPVRLHSEVFLASLALGVAISPQLRSPARQGSTRPRRVSQSPCKEASLRRRPSLVLRTMSGSGA
jgi:hypothetical protein